MVTKVSVGRYPGVGVEYVSSQQFMRNMSSLTFTGSEWPRIEKRQNLQRAANGTLALTQSRPVSALVSSSVQFHHEEMKIMHVKGLA